MKKGTIVVVLLLSAGFSARAVDYQTFHSDNSGLPYNSLYCISFDNNGNTWLGGQKDETTGLAFVSQLSRQLDKWTVYESADLGLAELEDRAFYIAVDDRNTKWFCTHYGVSWKKNDGTSGVVDFTKDKYTRTVQTDSRGTIYISMREDNREDARLWTSSDYGETWDPWTLADMGFSLGEADARPEIYDLLKDSKGQLWICTWYGVTYRKTDGTWDVIDELEGKYTYAMTITPDDRVFVADNGSKDLYEIAPDLTITTHDSTTIEPLKYAVLDLETDFNGNVWCATDGGGLLKIAYNGGFSAYTMESTGGDIPENGLTDIKINHNVIWAATDTSGLVRIDGLVQTGENAMFTSENSELPYNSVYCIDFDNYGNIWFGGQRDDATGLAFVSQLSQKLDQWTVYEQAQLGLAELEDRAFYIAVDERNTKWFCTHYGVSWLKNDGTSGVVDFTKDKYTRTVQTDGKGNVYISQREDNREDSRLWVSSDFGATWTPWSLADMGFSLGEADARAEVYDLGHDSKGQLWICTWYGLTRRAMDGTWKTIGELEGQYTFAMTIDPDDQIWVPDAGNKNLYKIMPDETAMTMDSTDIEALKYYVNDIQSDWLGHIWCATDGAGLLEILPDGSTRRYTAETHADIIPENNLTHLEIRNNVIWVSGASEGISRITSLGAGPVSVDNNKTDRQPSRFKLYANYPNPFNPATTIRFDLDHGMDVKLCVYNIKGHLVKELDDRRFSAGSHKVVWDGKDANGNPVATGLYIYRLTTEGESASAKMMLMK